MRRGKIVRNSTGIVVYEYIVCCFDSSPLLIPQRKYDVKT